MQTQRFKTKPYDHQLRYLNEHGRREYSALLAEMGTGKSFCVINNVADLWSTHDLDGLLVIAPNGVHYNWTMQEIPKHMPDWVRMRIAHWSSSMNKQEKKDFAAIFEGADSTELRIFAMNAEAIGTKRGFEAAQKFCMSCRRLMIAVDESDLFKNPTAARTKALMKLKPLAAYRRIMTGTAITNSPFDAFSQFMFLDETILRTTSYFSFKAEYAEMLHENHPLLVRIMEKQGKVKKDENGNKIIVGRAPQVMAKNAEGRPAYKNLDKLNRLIAPHSFRVLKKDCLDLPSKIYKTAYYEMTKEQQLIYDKARDESRLVLAGEDTPFNRLAIMTKMAQITSGYYLHPEAAEPVRIEGDNPRLDLLRERVLSAVNEHDKKVIVWARFRVQIEDIVRTLEAEGLKVVQYHGGVSRDDRLETLEEFTSGDAQVFVGNQQAGGVGITLVESSFVVYFSQDFSLRNRLQSEDRAHRIGQEEDVIYLDLIAKNSIDDSIVGALVSKKSVADVVLNF